MEIWKDIKGYEGLYQVSNYGMVRSLNYRHTGKAKILRQSKTKWGYLIVCLYKDRKSKWFSVHRIVASTFIANPLNLPCVNHRNEAKTDNIVENLEFCDYKYNNNYGTHIERSAKKHSKPVLQYTKTGEFIREWTSIIEVKKKLGYGNGNISNCCLKKIKSAYGYIWKYKKEAV